MTWLVVLGAGSWAPERGVRFKAGKHEVDDAMGARAKASGLKQLIVFDTEPEIVQKGPGPLKPDDIQFGNSGVWLPQPEVEPDAEYEYEIPRIYPCQWCRDARFPSQAALGRHVKVHHPDFAAG